MRGRHEVVGHHLKGLSVALGLALTTGALGLLHALDPTPAHAVELTVLVGANLCATVMRYLAMRTWVFGRARRRRARAPIEPFPPPASAVPPSAAPVADLAAVALGALDDGVLIEAGGEVLLANRPLRTMAGDLVGRPVPRCLRDAAADPRPTLLPDGSDAEITTLRNHVVQSEREAELLRLAHPTASPGCSTSGRSPRACTRRPTASPPSGARSRWSSSTSTTSRRSTTSTGTRPATEVLAEAARRLERGGARDRHGRARRRRGVRLAAGRRDAGRGARRRPPPAPRHPLGSLWRRAAHHRLLRRLRPGRRSGPETLLERADLALYWAKAEFLLRASAETTGGAFSIIEEIGPLDTPLHVHEHEDELFYVVEGEHVFRVGDEEHRAGPGAVVFAQRDGTIGPEADARASRRYGIAWL